MEDAKQLLATRENQMEALVVQECFRSLFTPEEFAEARCWLDELDYFLLWLRNPNECKKDAAKY